MPSNNFDFLRLLFAVIVCVVHAKELSGFEALSGLTSVLSSAVAVKAFFVVSGYLIFMSFDRSSSVWSYATKRIRRIYPAYFTVVMMCALGLFAVSSVGFEAYFSGAWVKYLWANLVFLNFIKQDLPGVFEGNTWHVVNGALWTLKIEVLFYIAVPLIAYVLRRIGAFKGLIVIYVMSVAYQLLCIELAVKSGNQIYVELGRQLPGQLAYFCSGAFFYYFSGYVSSYRVRLLLVSLAALWLNAYFPVPWLEPFALGTVVIFVATYRYLGNFGKFGDFSYGFYILHFPIIQLAVQFGWHADSPWLFLASVLSVTGLGAIAMWHWVEKRFLSRSNHYVFATS